MMTTISSCVNDIPYNAEIGDTRLVLNAMLFPDSILSVTVSHTSHFLDTEEPQRISDAFVTAIVNETSLNLIYSPYTQDYRCQYTLHSGDEVTITATHPIGTATATQHVVTPRAISIAHTTMQPYTIPGDPVSMATLNRVDSALMVGIYINDPIDRKDFYRLTIDYQGHYNVSIPNEIYSYNYNQNAKKADEENNDTLVTECFYPHYLFTENSSRLMTDSESTSQLIAGLFYLTSENSIIFSDEHLRDNNNEEPIVNFLMLMEYPQGNRDLYDPENGWENDDYDWNNDFITAPIDTISQSTYNYHFILETLSEDYYLYLRQASSYNAMGGLSIGEPAHIHSNIYGGLGIVGSYGSSACKGHRVYRLE
jgi:hypothetical protein